MASPYSYEVTQRRHCDAVYNWFGGVHFDYGAHVDLHGALTINRDDFPLLRVNATPQRAAAEVVTLLVETGWIAGSNATVQAENAEQLRKRAEASFSVLPLPLLTLRFGTFADRPVQAGVPKMFRKQCFDKESGEYQSHPWPAMYELQVDATFWCIKRYTYDHFLEWLASQFGRPGVAPKECLIPVVHDYPWGTIQQTLTWDSTNDESILEGDDERQLRFTHSFRLNVLHFRTPTPTEGSSSPGAASGKVGYIHDLNIVECPLVSGTGGGETWMGQDLVSAAPAPKPLSLSMFSVYLEDARLPTKWPKTGVTSAVRRNYLIPVDNGKRAVRKGDLDISVQATTDEVLLSNRHLPLDVSGLAVVMFHADYLAHGTVDMLLASQDPAVDPVVWVPSFRKQLTDTYGPPLLGWQHVSWFALLTFPVFSLTVVGRNTGSQANIRFANTRFHHVRTFNKTAPSSTTPGGAATTYVFNTQAGAHLVVVVLAAGAVASTVVIDGDNYAVDPAAVRGLVALVASNGSITVVVPNGLTHSQVYVQPYGGYWIPSAV